MRDPLTDDSRWTASVTPLDATHVLVEPAEGPEPDHALYEQASPTSRAVLVALQAKHIYGGTVPHHVKERRRKRNRVARASRKANR